MSRPARNDRSRRRGRRAKEARKTTAVRVTSITVTRRLANSILEWMVQLVEYACLKQVGQSGHPRPEPVRRTAAPVRIIRIIEMNAARANQRKTAGLSSRRGEEATHTA